MELRQIRSFVILAEELHFGRAASRLFLAQPALSQQIKQLEESLGSQLFLRTSRSVSLTEAGKAFLPHARAALQELHVGQENLQSVDSGSTGVLHIGFISTAAVQLIPNLISRLKKIHPGIKLQLKEADTAVQVKGLLSGEFDLGLMHATELHPALKAYSGESSDIMVALPAKHPLAQSSRIALKELAGETLILPSPTPHRDFHDLIVSLCESNGFYPSDRQEVTMLQTALPLIAAGAGCALLPDAFEQLRPRGVTFRKLSGARIRLPIYAVVRQDRTSKLLRNVLEQIHATEAINR